MRTEGAVAVVSGGASGLGRATVERLVSDGARVVVLDLPGEAGERLTSELGSAVSFVPADVTDEEQVAGAIDRAAELGPLRIAVLCAGVAPSVRVLGRRGVHPLEVFTRTVMVNVVGTFNVLRLAAARMAETEPVDGERGVVVCTASIAAYDGQIGQAAYAASKGGVVGMTLPVARDLAASLVRVVTIAPGIFLTPMLMGLPEEAQASLGAQVPHPSRLGDPAEYAALVAHIVANPMLNGEVIRLDGALRMAPR